MKTIKILFNEAGKAKMILYCVAAIFIIIFGYYSYRSENCFQKLIEIKHNDDFGKFSLTLKSGFYFQVANISPYDLNSIKMTIVKAGDTLENYVHYPHATIFRNTVSNFDTSQFLNSSGTSFEPKAGETVNINFECLTPFGSAFKTSQPITYKKKP